MGCKMTKRVLYLCINAILSVIMVGSIAVNYVAITGIKENISENNSLMHAVFILKRNGIEMAIIVTEKDSVEKVKKEIQKIVDIDDGTALDEARKIVNMVRVGVRCMIINLS